MKLSVENLLTYLSYIVTVATVLRIGLHWGRELLKVWVPPRSSLWPFYDKIELSLAYIAGSLAAFGRKTPLSSLEAPVTQAQSASEGRIAPPDARPSAPLQ